MWILFVCGDLKCSGVLKWLKTQDGLLLKRRRLWDRWHLTLSVQCPRLWCLKGWSPSGKPYCCSRNSSCSSSKLHWGGTAETQQLKIDCCRHWGIQRNFLHTVNVLQNHINCLLTWKWLFCYCFVQGLNLVLAWIALGHAERSYFPCLSISSRAINAFPWSLTCNVSQLSNKMLS